MSELTWLLSRLGEPRSIIDIAVVTGLLFWLLWVLQGTRATQLLRGAAIFLIGAIVLSRVLDLRALGWLIDNMWPVVIVAVPIIFQPELRRALEQLGHTGSWLRTSLPAGSDTSTMASTIDEVVRGRRAALPPAVRRPDGARTRDWTPGLRRPRRRARCVSIAAIAGHDLFSEFAIARCGGSDARRPYRRRQRRAARSPTTSRR